MKSSSATSFAITERDYEIVAAIGACGGLRAENISTLFFRTNPQTWREEPQSNAQRRLLLLQEHKLIEYIEQPSTRKEGRKPYIYILTKKGAHALADHYGKDPNEIPWRKVQRGRGMLFLDHLMHINDVRTAFTYAATYVMQHTEIDTWIDDAQLKRDHAKYKMDWKWPSGRQERSTVLIPDSFFVIKTTIPEPHTYRHFLEVDLSSETLISRKEERTTWERKIRMYNEFLKPGGLYEEHYEARSARVITVTNSEKRLAHLKETTERAGGRSRFWFSTLKQLTPLSVLSEPIWQQAGKEGQVSFLWD